MDEKLSLLISHILDKLGYNEEIRQYRINKYNDENFVRTLCSNRILLPTMLAGSKAEGTSRWDESDYDYLLVYFGFKATECEDIVDADSDIRLYMETDTAPAGYCRLQLLQCDRENIHHKMFLRHDCYVRIPGHCRSYLSSTFVVSTANQYMSGKNEICGPANKQKSPGMAEMDKVVAIRCSHLPRSLKCWLRRHEQATWPTKQVMEQIAETDVFLVPVGKHGSDYQFLEWRLSFNMAEKLLIQNFTIVQYRVYILLKKIMKEVVEPKCPKSITSYIVKTLMLWAVEQIPTELWRNQKLLNILVHLIKKLQRCVQYGSCSMYFIPEDNILEGRINADTQQIVSCVLSSLLDDGILCVLKVPSIARQVYHFMYAIVPAHDHYQDSLNEKTTILVNQTADIHKHSLDIIARQHLHCCHQEYDPIPYKDLLTDLVSVATPAGSEREKLVEYHVSQTLSHLALQRCVDVTTQWESNIQKYTGIRQCIRIVYRNCHTNVLRDTMTLAAVFHMLGLYRAALDVMTTYTDKVRYYMIKRSYRNLIQKSVCHSKLVNSIGNGCLSCTQVLKFYCIPTGKFDFQMEPCLPKALKYEVCDGRREEVETDSEILFYFLQFLCYTQQGQRRLADVAFTNLAQWSTRRDSNIEYREVALNVLGHLLLKKGLCNQAARVLIKSIMVSKQYVRYSREFEINAAVWHLAILLNTQQMVARTS